MPQPYRIALFSADSDLAEAFRNLGCEVLTIEEKSQNSLENIQTADALYLNGEIDDVAHMNVGFAHALGIPVFCQGEPESEEVAQVCELNAGPEDVKTHFEDRSPVEAIRSSASVEQLQTYIRGMVARRGFEDESAQDVLLLMTEEVGELAKAARKYVGLKSEENRQDRYSTLESEMADVFIYLLQLANLFEVSLVDALYEKEQENEKRTWS